MNQQVENAEPEFLVERRDGLGIILINRVKLGNSIGKTFGRNLMNALTELESDDSISAIVLSGKGKVFCAGARIGEVISHEGVNLDEQFRANQDVVKAVGMIRNFSLPIICALNGIAVGGGTAIALACDLVVAAQSSSYLFAFGRVGASAADMGCSYQLLKAVGTARARHILLTGASVSAEQGKDIGLFVDVVASESLMDTAIALARSVVASAPRRALAATKQVILRAETTEFDACLFYEFYLQSYFLNTDEHRGMVKAFIDSKKAA